MLNSYGAFHQNEVWQQQRYENIPLVLFCVVIAVCTQIDDRLITWCTFHYSPLFPFFLLLLIWQFTVLRPTAFIWRCKNNHHNIEPTPTKWNFSFSLFFFNPSYCCIVSRRKFFFPQGSFHAIYVRARSDKLCKCSFLLLRLFFFFICFSFLLVVSCSFHWR